MNNFAILLGMWVLYMNHKIGNEPRGVVHIIFQ